MKLYLFLIGNFILTITRVLEDLPYNISKSIKVKRKLTIPNKLAICKFENLDALCDFCTYLEKYKFIHNLSSSLFIYNSTYYLALEFINFNMSDFKFLCYLITEFATFVNDSNTFVNILTEKGEQIINKNAIQTFCKYFNCTKKERLTRSFLFFI